MNCSALVRLSQIQAQIPRSCVLYLDGSTFNLQTHRFVRNALINMLDRRYTCMWDHTLLNSTGQLSNTLDTEPYLWLILSHIFYAWANPSLVWWVTWVICIWVTYLLNNTKMNIILHAKPPKMLHRISSNHVMWYSLDLIKCIIGTSVCAGTYP